MKNCKKAMTILLTAAVLLTAVFMTGCTRLTPAQDDAPPTADTPATWKNGVYIRVERDDVASVYMRGGSFSKVGENADGSALKAGEWMFAGDDIAALSEKEDRAVLFTVGARTVDDNMIEDNPKLKALLACEMDAWVENDPYLSPREKQTLRNQRPPQEEKTIIR